MIITDPRIVVPWVAERCECPTPGSAATGIGLVQHGKLVAGVMYERFTGRSIFVSLGIDPGRYLDRRFVWAICDYPFNQLGVERVGAFINSSNTRSIKIAKHIGFVVAASVPDMFYDGDLLVATLSRSDCKWLGKGHGRKSQNTKST